MGAIELASGDSQDRVPFGALRANQRQFIDPKYHPAGFKFDDPRNIKKDDILQFCHHVHDRQEKNGVADAFRFLKYQRGGEMQAVRYGIREGEQKAADRALKQKAAREAKKGAAAKAKRAKGKAKNKASVPETARQSVPEPTLQPGANPRSDAMADGTAFAIDPALLGPEERGPRPTTLADAQPAPVLIGETDRRILYLMGHPTLIPVNGPSDGPPQYLISPSAQEDLARYRAGEDLSNIAAGARTTRGHSKTTLVQELKEVPLKKQVPSKKRGLNADARAVQEAKALLKGKGRSRRK